MRPLADIEFAITAVDPAPDTKAAADELLQLSEEVIEHWIVARDEEPTSDKREGFRLLALRVLARRRALVPTWWLLAPNGIFDLMYSLWDVALRSIGRAKLLLSREKHASNESRGSAGASPSQPEDLRLTHHSCSLNVKNSQPRSEPRQSQLSVVTCRSDGFDVKATAATFLSPNVVNQTRNLFHLADSNHRQGWMRSVTAGQLNRAHAEDAFDRSLCKADVIDVDHLDSIGLTCQNSSLVNESLRC